MTIQKQCDSCAYWKEQNRILQANNDRLKDALDNKNAMLDLARQGIKGVSNEPQTLCGSKAASYFGRTS